MSLLKRMENIQRYLEENELDILVLDDTTSLYYLTGLQMSAGVLLIARQDVSLFVDGRYMAIAKKMSPFPVGTLNEEAIADFFNMHGANLSKQIGFNAQKTSYASYKKLNDLIEKIKDQKKVIQFKLISIDNPLRTLMMTKDSVEIQKMKRAANLTWRAFQHICSFIKEGITEEEVAIEFEFFCRKNGAEAMAFPPIIAFGKNTAFPHHKTSGATLTKDDAVLIDVGVILDHYCSDMTRMIFMGESSKEVEKLYFVVKKAQNKALSICRPGVRIGELDRIAREEMAKEGLERLFVHSLGHGVGLQVHEYPRIKWDGEDKDVVLKPGMILTIEPGLYDPEIGGARYEDMILITQEGYENFFSSV